MKDASFSRMSEGLGGVSRVAELFSNRTGDKQKGKTCGCQSKQFVNDSIY